jgi:hypothetical protein
MNPMPVDDWIAVFNDDVKVAGVAAFGITLHVPCPVCAAPDLVVSRMPDAADALAAGASCAVCDRSFAAELTRSVNASRLIEVVQTGGDDAPAELDPPIRRVF